MSQNIDEKITSSDVALNSQENLGFDIQNQENCFGKSPYQWQDIG